MRSQDVLALEEAQAQFHILGTRVKRQGKAYSPTTEDLEFLEYFEGLTRSTRRPNDLQSAVWLRAHLLRNVGRLDEARAALLSVRDSREAARALNRSLTTVAGVTGQFPNLAAFLCELSIDRSPAEMFDAIEWTKGRALSDRHENSGWGRLDELQDALAATGAHYLTYLQDSKEVFAVLVSSNGVVRGHRIPLDVARIASHVAQERLIRLDESVRRRRFEPQLSWRSDLAALADPVREAIEDGRIALGDVLLISPHKALTLLPLHAIDIEDSPLGTICSVVRVHSAADMIRDCADPTPARPRDALAVRAPTAPEMNNFQHIQAFEHVTDALKVGLGQNCEVLDGPAATLPSIKNSLKGSSVVHFMTHGDVATRGPLLERSYLALSSEGHLTERSGAHGVRLPGALTAQELIAIDAADLSGAHVTLQACVSGHAQANPQGDLIGLEWVFLMAGASSTLGSHWHVDFREASSYCAAFYRAWLQDEKSRAEAWSAAGKQLREEAPGYGWAAFSLTGDWR